MRAYSLGAAALAAASLIALAATPAESQQPAPQIQSIRADQLRADLFFLAGDGFRGRLTNTPENLTRWIHNPGEVKPGNLMSSVIKPGMISDQDIADIVAFLESQTITIQKPEQR